MWLLVVVSFNPKELTKTMVEENIIEEVKNKKLEGMEKKEKRRAQG